MESKPVGRKNIKQYLAEKPHLEELYDGNLAYIAAEKESVSGMFNNERFIVLNGKQLTLGYSNTLPDIVPIGSFLNIKNIKKKAHLNDVLIQRSKHKLKAIEIIVQKFMYKDREEKIPEDWVFFVSSTKAADETVQLFNRVKENALAQAATQVTNQLILAPISHILGDKEVRDPSQSLPQLNLQTPELSPVRKKSQIKITPEPVIQISIENKPKHSPTLSINPVLSVVSQPKHFMYSQAYNRYQLNEVSIPSYYNQTVIQQPPLQSASNQSREIPQNSRQEVSQNSIQYPVTHHIDSPRMPQSMIQNPPPSQNSIKYELQIKPIQPSIVSSGAQTKHSYPNNSVINNSPGAVEASEKQVISQRAGQQSNSQYLSMANSNFPKSQNVGNNPPSASGIVVNIDSSRKDNIDAILKQPISPIQKRPRNKSRYALDNSDLNSASNSPASPQRFSDQKEKLVNVWDQQSPQNADFTLKSSPVKNRISPSKVLQGPQDEAKSNKRRRTQYSVLKDCKDWNQQLYFSMDPLDTVLKFKQFSCQLVTEIINSLGSLDAKYHVLKQSQSEVVYEHQNLIITMGFNANSDKQPTKQLQKDVEHYIYMNQVLQNKQFCRVPLVNLIKYKGITVLVKATLGNSTKINKSSLANQIKKLELLTKIPREEFSKCNFKLVTYFNRGASSEIIFIDDLEQLIPQTQTAYRKQLLEIAAKEKGLIESVFLSKLLEKQIDKFLTSLQTLELAILSSEDLYTQLYKHGISKEEIGVLFNKSSTDFTKQIFTSQLLSDTAAQLFCSHLQNQIKSLARQKQRHSDRYLVQAAYEFMDDLCSATNNSEALWDVIMNDTESKYKVKLERKHLMWGYFLSAFLFKGGLKFNINSLDKSTGFSEEYNCINVHSLEGFECKSVCSDVDYVESIAKTKAILSQAPSEFGYEKIRGYLQNSSYMTYIKDHSNYFNPLLIYISNFIPADITTKTILNPYEAIPPEPSSLTTIQLSLSKMKWLLKHKDEESAVALLQQNCGYITFWGAEFHPLLSQFYDLVAAYYVGIGESEQALTLSKSSLVNIIKLVGNNSLATADKFYFLANVMYNIGKYEEAFGNFSKAREILLEHSISNTILGKIQLKMAILYLHFNKLTDSELAAREALEVFQRNKEELLLVETYELLDRLHRTENNPTSIKQNAFACASKLQSSRNEEVYCRTLKLSLTPFLSELSSQQKRTLLQTIQMINISLAKKEYFNWLFKKSNVIQTIVNYLRGIEELVKQMRVANVQKYKGIHAKTENQLFIFLSYMEAVIGVGELATVTGVLRTYE